MQININGSKHRVPLNSIEWCCHNLMTNIEQRLPASLFIYHSGESCWSASYSKHNYYNTYTVGPLIRLWNLTILAPCIERYRSIRSERRMVSYLRIYIVRSRSIRVFMCTACSTASLSTLVLVTSWFAVAAPWTGPCLCELWRHWVAGRSAGQWSRATSSPASAPGQRQRQRVTWRH